MRGCHRHLREWDCPQRKLMETFMGISRQHRMVLERRLNKTGVYRSQHQILMYIADNPNVSQKEIAELHHVSTATIAVSLKKLEHGGYIKRVVDQEDNRFNQICITQRGSAVVEQSNKYFHRVETQLFGGFSQEDMDQLQGYLDRMWDNLDHMLSEAESEEEE